VSVTTPTLDLNAAAEDAATAALAAVMGDSPETPDPSTPPAPADAPDAPAAVNPITGTDAETEATAEADADADAEPVVLPEGFVAVPVVSDQLATEFTLRDAEGEVEVPALIVEYKANGKVRQDRLDQVVKLAQWGVYNEERDRKAQAIEQDYQQVATTAQQLEQLVAEREAQIERLLQDDEFLYAVRDAYSQETTPERQLARVEQEKEALQIGYAMQQITAEGERFYTAEVAPAVQMITDALPTITPAEVETRLQMVLHAHAERAPNGQPYVPSSRYEAIRQYIVEDLVLWAQMAHARRTQPAAAASTETHAMQAELERAQVSAQKAKNLVSRVTKPTGQTMRRMASAAPASPPATIDDAVESALSTALASLTS
jgi:hypothetical protein